MTVRETFGIMFFVIVVAWRGLMVTVLTVTYCVWFARRDQQQQKF